MSSSSASGPLPTSDHALHNHAQRPAVHASQPHPYASPARMPLAGNRPQTPFSSAPSPVSGPARQLTPNTVDQAYDGPQHALDDYSYRGGHPATTWHTNIPLSQPSAEPQAASDVPPVPHGAVPHLHPPAQDMGVVPGYHLQYAPSAGYPSTRQTSISAGSRSVVFDLERMLGRLKLEHRRVEVYSFRELDFESKLDNLFLHFLKLEDMHAATGDQFHALNTRIASLELVCREKWQPTKAQIKLIHSLTRHYLMKPLPTYNGISEIVKDFIKKNPQKFRLEKSSPLLCLRPDVLNSEDDNVIKLTVNTCVNEVMSQMKSSFRKAVFNSCKSAVSLESFTLNLLDNYHLPAIPAEAPLSLLGTFAMMRKIADSLAKKTQTGRGGDTGFWQAVETELHVQYNKAAPSRDRNKDAFWIEWADARVADDHALFSNRRPGRRSRRPNGISPDEFNVALNAGTENLDSGLTNPGSPSHSNPSLPSDDEDHMEDDTELPDLNTMGDIDSTIAVPQ
ncbi:hypothetical protein BV20DRAFT_1056409 [Pilatotrama ljubarskyi]|nr:hypothetical protein BV20DRAFT_1056409 [Pilatotrama ljubarskyi]